MRGFELTEKFEKTDDHLRILRDAPGGKDRQYVLVPPIILELIMIPEGQHRGWFTITARGRNDMNEVTVMELRKWPNEELLDAFCVYDLLRRKLLHPLDVEDFHVTRKLRLTAQDEFRKVFGSWAPPATGTKQ